MRKWIGIILAILMAGLWLLSEGHAETGREEIFFKANQAYREDHFQEAIDGYLRLIKTGQEGGAVCYNLGNAYFKAGRLGKAIWAYERALLWMPRDPDLRFNLSHARDQTRDAINDPGGSIGTIFFWLNSFTLDELFACFAILNLLFWLLLLIRLFYRREWIYYLLLISLSLWFVSGLSFGLKYYRISSDDRAVVTQEAANILAGPDKGDTVLFKLHEGAVVHCERSEDGWSLIRLPDNKRGWVSSKAIAQISGHSPGL